MDQTLSLKGITPFFDRYVNGAFAGRTYGAAQTSSVRSWTVPDPNAPKRAKPSPSELVFSGVDYTKERRVRRHFLYCRKGVVGSTTTFSNESSQIVIGDFWQNLSFYPSDPVDPKNRLFGKLRDDLANVANMLGEYKQTGCMFNDSVRILLKSYRYARYGNFKSAIKALGMIGQGLLIGKSWRPGDAYLRWHFGVETLMSDMYKLANQLQEQASKEEKPRLKAVVSAKNVETKTVSAYSGLFQKTFSGFTQIKYTAYAEVDNTQLKLASDHGLLNPLSLAWELTTFSFVLDWFIGVGEWLQSLDMPFLFTRTKVYKTTRKTVEAACVHQGTSKTALFVTPAKAYGAAKFTSRISVAFTPSIPRWKPNLTTSRVLVSLGLLHQAFGKR